MANIFMHFEPIAPLSEPNPVFRGDLPPYVIPGSLEEPVWRRQNPDGWVAVQTQRLTPGITAAHFAATNGDLAELESVLDLHPSYANVHDEEFGWTPLHEAVRGRRVDIVKMLLDKGADMNALTKEGQSVLGLAYYYVATDDPHYSSDPDSHPVIQHLNTLGATRIPAVRSGEL